MAMDNNDLVRILFLTSEPTDANRLRLGQELRDIREKLQLSKYRQKYHLESRESVRPEDISQAIFDVEPQIVHFSGHGGLSGELCFENQQGKMQPISIDALGELFELISGQVQCVLLNACYSEIQAKAIACHIPYVIGMNKEIGDKSAILFARGFYKALGAKRSIKDSFKFGCLEIRLSGFNEYHTPVLLSEQRSERNSTVQDSSSQKSSLNEDNLSSSKNIDYSKLCDLLREQQWQSADQETVGLMLEAVGRQRDDWLRSTDLRNFPPIDLRTIDSLWIKYSQNHFGFSVQRRVWKDLGAKDDWQTECAMSERLGWRINNQWIKYESLNFSLEAPKGHLPAVNGWIGGKGWNERCSLLSRSELDA